MTIRCKFFCQSITKTKHWDQDRADKFLYTAKFLPVIANSPENDAFFDSTPCGSIEVGTYLENRFEVGRDYYIDIIPVEPNGPPSSASG